MYSKSYAQKKFFLNNSDMGLKKKKVWRPRENRSPNCLGAVGASGPQVGDGVGKETHIHRFLTEFGPGQ